MKIFCLKKILINHFAGSGSKKMEMPRGQKACNGGQGSQPLEDLRILLVEDGIDNQVLIKTILKNSGAEVCLAENGKIAIEKASMEQFDIILMDMQMPEMDGYEATRLLRSEGFEKPILALTANTSQDDQDSSINAGCNDVMTKPVRKQKLIDAVYNYAVGNGTGSVEGVESDFADDPDLAEVIEDFVSGLDSQLKEMRAALNNSCFDELKRMAHQLKGAGGSYGYQGITEASRGLEDAAKAQDHEASKLALSELGKICGAVVRGRRGVLSSKGALK